MKDAEILEDKGGSLVPGEVYLANESRLVEANFSQPLTAYALGWRDPSNILDTLNFIAPEVPTTRRFEFAKHVNAEQFLSEADDLRAIGASFKRVDYTSEKQTAKTLNKGLTIRVDLDNVTGMTSWRNIYTARILQRLYRNELRRALAILAGAATSTGNFAWGGSTAMDADLDLINELILARDSSGIAMNRVLFGDQAWAYRLKALRGLESAGGFSNAALTPEQLAMFLGVDRVHISRERYQSAAASKSKVVGASVYLFYGQDGLTPEDPSNIKRFTSPTEGGQKFRVYEQQVNAKLVDITVEHYSIILATSTLGIRELPITTS